MIVKLQDLPWSARAKVTPFSSNLCPTQWELSITAGCQDAPSPVRRIHRQILSLSLSVSPPFSLASSLPSFASSSVPCFVSDLFFCVTFFKFRALPLYCTAQTTDGQKNPRRISPLLHLQTNTPSPTPTKGR